MGISLNNLSAKFHPYLLGHASCPKKNLEKKIDKVFETELVPLKDDYIFNAGNWILKLPRTTGATCDDSHIYRIRKAEKIRKYISDHQLEDHMVVPKKFLYWNKNEKKFYVVSKRADLSDEVAKPIKIFAAQAKLASDLGLGGQCEAFAKGKPTRDLTPEQARGLAELSVIGYTDLTYNNLFFDKNGKVVILDTEPIKRVLLKAVANNKITSWLVDKDALLAQQSIIGMAKLKMYCNADALKEIEKVEKNHALWNIAKLIVKIAFYCLIIRVIPKAIAQLPLGAAAAIVLRNTLLALATLKVIMLTVNAASVAMMWNNSNNQLAGLHRMAKLEAQGIV